MHPIFSIGSFSNLTDTPGAAWYAFNKRQQTQLRWLISLLRKVLPQKYIAFVVGVCSQPFYKFLFARKAFYFYPVAKRILPVFSLVFRHNTVLFDICSHPPSDVSIWALHLAWPLSPPEATQGFASTISRTTL